MKIGVLYIATGPYIHFWNDFYATLERYFIPEMDKVYFLFTNEKIETQFDNVHVLHIEHKPWPLVTLLRFHTFLLVEEQLRNCEYLFFFNANLGINRVVCAEEVLPGQNESFVFTKHPGYYKKSPIYAPFERNKKSKAYVPYKRNMHYVIGAFFGGKADAFISMSKELRDNIDWDLKHNVIAKWHDESHINCFVLGRHDVKYLHPGYCYPRYFEIEEEKIIVALDKKSVFDINKFKGCSIEEKEPRDCFSRIKIKIGSCSIKIWSVIKVRWFCLRDLFKKVE